MSPWHPVFKNACDVAARDALMMRGRLACSSLLLSLHPMFIMAFIPTITDTADDVRQVTLHVQQPVHIHSMP